MHNSNLQNVRGEEGKEVRWEEEEEEEEEEAEEEAEAEEEEGNEVKKEKLYKSS